MSGSGGVQKGAQKNENNWGCMVAIIAIIAVLTVADLIDWGGGGDADVPVGGGLFGSRGAGHLVERLNDATRAQKICYGWKIDTDAPVDYREYTTPIRPANPAVPPPADLDDDIDRYDDDETDVGSNLGTGLDPREHPQQCPRWVVFTASYTYSYYEEKWTSVSIDIETNLQISIGEDALRRAGITRSDLLGSQATARLADAVGVLPMIVAEKGAAPQVPQPAASEPLPGDKPTPPGVARYVWMGIGGVLIAAGLTWIIVAAVRSRRSA